MTEAGIDSERGKGRNEKKIKLGTQTHCHRLREVVEKKGGGGGGGGCREKTETEG